MIEVYDPKTVVETKTIKIDEYFGCVAGSGAEMSACVVNVFESSQEAYQTPGFDEYVMVLEGTVELHWKDGEITIVQAGQGAFLPKLTRVKWVWPGKCKYIPICLPAFTPSNCCREDEENSDLAKSSQAMEALRQLHARAAHPFLLHVAPKHLWEKAISSAEIYYPPTFQVDGSFTHATADPNKLIAVLNHFYKASKDDYVCLKMTCTSLEQQGISTLFEHTSPVGDTPAIDMGDELFPHIQGGIPPAAVIDVYPVIRAHDGTFLSVPQLTSATSENMTAISRIRQQIHTHGAAFTAGLLAGVTLFSLVFARKH